MIDLSSFEVILFVFYCINSDVLSFRDICGHHHCDRVVNQHLHLDHRSDLPQVWRILTTPLCAMFIVWQAVSCRKGFFIGLI